MKRVTTCPLGSECEKVNKEDGTLEVCAWYTRVAGEHPQTGERVDQQKCAIAWIPIIAVEQSGETKHLSAAVESARNMFVELIHDRANTNKGLRQERPEYRSAEVGHAPELLDRGQELQDSRQ